MKMVLSAMLGLSLALGAVSLAFAEPPADRVADDAGAHFKKLDTDKDGKVSKAEFIAGNETEQSEEQATAKFTTADKDKDGFLTMDEYKTISGKPVEKKPQP